MKKTLLILWAIFLSIGCTVTSHVAYAQSRGHVFMTMEQHSGLQTYVYIFRGIVTHKGRAVPHANVAVQFNTEGREEFTGEAIADEHGRYQVTMRVEGLPEEAADWKVTARLMTKTMKVTEAEGRTILTSNEETQVVQRPLEFVQG